MMKDPLAHLHDIEGLDVLGWWPLAPGWWMVIILSSSALFLLSFWFYRKRVFEGSWRHAISCQLSEMEHTLEESTAQATVADLSELIRRIAMHQYSRSECAGLEGSAWLLWLTHHDPKRLDWAKKGKWLIEAPYAPSGLSIPLEDIRIVIKAIRRWVK